RGFGGNIRRRTQGSRSKCSADGAPLMLGTPMRGTAMLAHTWQPSRLGDAIALLARTGGVASRDARGMEVANPDSSVASGFGASAWIERAAGRLGCEAEPLETTFGDLERQIADLETALLRLPGGAYLAILRGGNRTAIVLTPERSTRAVPLREICDAIREPVESRRRSEIEALLYEAGVPARQLAKSTRSILREQLGATRFADCWMLRVPPGAATWRWLRQTNAPANALGLTLFHTIQYLLWVLSWWVMGQSALQGRVDRGWLLAWALLLFTLIPFRLLSTWLQGLLAVGVGGLLKQRLLAGALRLHPEEMRHQGAGQFLGQALEAETVETLALNGGIAGLLASVELAVASVVLGRYALVLLAWWILTLALSWRFLKNYQRWTEARLGMTHQLVEGMVGHRTRLAQQRRDQWHEEEDRKLDNYVAHSTSLDRSGTMLIAAVPRGWIVAGLLALAPAFVAGSPSNSETAVALGGILLAYLAFKRLTGSLSDMAAAWVAGKRISHLFAAAERREIEGELSRVEDSPADQTALETDAIAFRYRDRGEPVLRACSLRIARGDRILVEGPSGGGKTTLVSILAGMRQPESGTLIAGGLDFPTLGARRWRKRVVSAPQFHENHMLTETLAFNLLMGRRWPPTPDDMEQAEVLCRELGLGELVDRMPGGLLQIVGESGWQLSHGERSRVFMARALLQNAGVVILDESFAALDPETLQTALRCALRRSETLLVVAHP
ncbi:MAG: ABC transporter ATP-binding protein/permease, partial [Acidobacteriota bacterium]|nr:ABC transporter ATP-binding protein/permease [Acidobacteriota bacterium]